MAYSGTSLWTSGTNVGQQGKFNWAESGKSFGHYNNWATGEPVGGESCVQLWGAAGHKWDDVPCFRFASYICETGRC